MVTIEKEVIDGAGGEQLLQFTQEELDLLGWKIGDKLIWKTQKDGTAVITKYNPKLKMRTCIKCNGQFQSNTLKYCRECTDEQNAKEENRL